MWHWIRNRKRKKILAQPFPKEWKAILKANLSYYAHLSSAEKKRLEDLIQVFVAEKYWIACNGIEITDEIRVTIAAHACVMILELPHDYYDSVNTIYVYPSTVVRPELPLGVFEIHTSPVSGPLPILGEAHLRGPVVLVWDAIEHEARHPERGHNVVFHEFAHKLDMLDGSADGTPPLASREEQKRWNEICSQEYKDLKKRVGNYQNTFFDPYAAVSEAEFFAVVSEYFFSKPHKMKQHHPKLYGVLKSFYRQDPERKLR